MNYTEAVEAYNALEFKGRSDFYGWHKFLMELLPKKKRIEDRPDVLFDLKSKEKISKLANHYLNRDLGPADYCFLPEKGKERRRMEFCDNHKLLSFGEPVPETPNELIKLYIDVHRERWSKDGRMNKEQVHTVYDEVRGEQKKKITPEWMRENWVSGIEEINKRMYEDIVMSFIPQGQLGLFDWQASPI